MYAKRLISALLLGLMGLGLTGCLGSSEQEEPVSRYAPGQPLTQQPGRRVNFLGADHKPGASWRVRKHRVRVSAVDKRPVGFVRYQEKQAQDGQAQVQLELVSFSQTQQTSPLMLDAKTQELKLSPELVLRRQERGWLLLSPGSPEVTLAWIEQAEESPFGRVYRLSSAPGQAELGRAFMERTSDEVVVIYGDKPLLRLPNRALGHSPVAALVMTLEGARQQPLAYSGAAIALSLIERLNAPPKTNEAKADAPDKAPAATP